MGYRLEITRDLEILRPLLHACDLPALDELHEDDPARASYLIASTQAGGLAACAGWTYTEPDALVLHSLAVAPATRGSGLGARLLATAIGERMDRSPVQALYLCTDRARRFFSKFGFRPQERADVPSDVVAHPSFRAYGRDATPMVRAYGEGVRGLDKVAFRLIHNTTPGATLPAGSVFYFTQHGEVLEAFYRGGPVTRGHLIGSIAESQIDFSWHQHVRGQGLMQGMGEIVVRTLDDGRRELREALVGEESPGELLLREI